MSSVLPQLLIENNKSNMNNDIQVFNNEQFGAIRTAGTADNPTFCLSDVCKILALDSSAVMRRLDDGVISSHPIQDSLGRTQQANFVNEDGLYDVILDSRKPEAKAFRKWVTSEVLPSIRKTGSYSANSLTALPDFTNPAEAARAWAEQYELKLLEAKRADEAEHQVTELSCEIETMKPKANYYDVILNNKSTVLTTQIALDYGMSAKALNKKLADLRIQHKVGDQWILYAPYISQGYMHSRPIEIQKSDGTTKVKYNSEWTQKGRIFLYDKLKSVGIRPLIET